MGVSDTSLYLVSLVDSVKVRRVYTTSKRNKWYEIPGSLSVNGTELPGFCMPVKCMVDLVEYDYDNPGSSVVTLAWSHDPGRPTTLPLPEVTNTRDPNIKKAFEYFKADNETWAIVNNIEHIPATPNDDGAEDNDSGD